jgi:DNA-binding CsgD family transcriptional regulator
MTPCKTGIPVPKSILAEAGWQQAVADMIGALDTNEFYSHFARGCEMISGYQSALIVWLSSTNRPINLYDDLPDELAQDSTRPWFEGAYLLDPFYSLFTDNAPEGIYYLQDLAPDNFYTSDYYRSYYTLTGLTEECGMLINLDGDHSILVSLGSRGAPPARTNQLANLQTVMPVLSALCHKQQSAGAGEITMSAPLDRAFRNFGRDHLSARECEVIQLILKGHSNKSIAQLLEISVDTVKVYNKRFHTKLDISSQAELFSLFLEAIALVPFDADIDPLTHYREITGG